MTWMEDSQRIHAQLYTQIKKSKIMLTDFKKLLKLQERLINKY